MLLPGLASGVGVLGQAPHLALTSKYRELLRKFRGQNVEDQRLVEQARERLGLDVVLLRLQERRRRGRLDPRGALQRTKERFLQAQLSLRELKNEHKQRLRQYYHTAVRGGAGAAMQQRPSLPVDKAAVDATAMDAAALQAALGSDGLFRSLVVASVGGACKLFLAGASRTQLEGAERMRAALERPAGQALITVSNHVGSIDDPLITSALVPPRYLLHPSAVRWTMCASDRCFKSKALAPFFRAAKVLPVERGKGIDQCGMRAAASRLAAGDWVHIFPEGTRSRTGKMGPVRRGVGWLVASCEQPPLVLPFVHSGMERVIPPGSSLPQPGQEVRVLVGEPVAVDDLMAEARSQGWPEAQLQAAITHRVGQALYVLKAQLEGVAVEEVAPAQAATALSLSDDRLLPLLEAEMDALRTTDWRDAWQRWGLPSLSARLRAAVAARAASGAGRLAFGVGDELAGSVVLGGSLNSGSGINAAAAAAGEQVVGQQGQSVPTLAERLQVFLAATRDYSSARMQHMRALVQQQASPMPAVA